MLVRRTVPVHAWVVGSNGTLSPPCLGRVVAMTLTWKNEEDDPTVEWHTLLGTTLLDCVGGFEFYRTRLSALCGLWIARRYYWRHAKKEQRERFARFDKEGEWGEWDGKRARLVTYKTNKGKPICTWYCYENQKKWQCHRYD